MGLSEWFSRQLQTSTDGFLWAVEQIPAERYYLPPRANRWSVARIVYHMICYDQRIGLPTLRQWVGGERPLVGSQQEDEVLEEANWQQGGEHAVLSMLAEFKTLRAEQIALIQHFPKEAWDEVRPAIWGSVPLRWAATKTYQHTLEHTDEILRAYLWWK